MSSPPSISRVETARGIVHAATRSQLQAYQPWREAFARSFTRLRKDARYYAIVEDAILQGFDYCYLVVGDSSGAVLAIQPFFVLNQDILQGAGRLSQSFAAKVRNLFPRFLTLRTLMVGCAAGEGHLESSDAQLGADITAALHQALPTIAKSFRAGMIVFKEFPAAYRTAMSGLSANGYTRVPSLPMVRLSIDYASFDDYVAKALSKNTRKNLRRKFRDAEEGGPIDLQVVEDITPHLPEAYPLYLNVYSRSQLHFEKLTPEYLSQLGRQMPDKVRFFLWRRDGKLVAFSLCMLQGDSLYDEYLGLDYAVALDLHLYFYTLRDIIQWAISHGFKWYVSSALNYDPKLHLRCHLAPLDLYVTHRSRIANFILRRVLPKLEPTRNDKVLQQFPNYADVWGTP